MKHLKLFEELNIDKEEFPEDGYELNSREKQILVDLVGEKFLTGFKIIKEDYYYYVRNDIYHMAHYNKLDGFNELRDYMLLNRHIVSNKLLLEFLKKTELDPSFDNNLLIRRSSANGHIEVVKLLLQDPRVDPSDLNNYAIRYASHNGHIEIVKLLLQDPRVDPSANNNDAIRWASKNRHNEIVKLLIKDPRVREKLTEKEIKKYEAY